MILVYFRGQGRLMLNVVKYENKEKEKNIKVKMFFFLKWEKPAYLKN